MEKRRNAKAWVVGMMSLGLLATSVCCFALALIGGQTQRTKPAISVTFVSQNPTIIAATFSSPTPTNRPTPNPNVTSAPVRVPDRTADPVSFLDESEARYLDEVIEILEIYNSAFDNIRTLSAQAAQSPLLIVNDEWRIKMIANLVLLVNAGEMLRKLLPPASMVEIHTELVSASRHYDFAVEQIAKGLDSMNSSYIEEAVMSIEAANRHLRKAEQRVAEIETTRLRSR